MRKHRIYYLICDQPRVWQTFASVYISRSLCYLRPEMWKYISVDKDFDLDLGFLNGSVTNRENLQYKKTADSVLLSLFVRIN